MWPSFGRHVDSVEPGWVTTMDVKEEKILGPEIAQHWYYVSKGRALRQFVKPFAIDEVLDVGAGSGVFSRQLLDFGICQRAICVDTAYATERTEVLNGKKIRFRRSIDEVSQKLVLMIDVLEHVDDDIAMLRQYSESMPRDGHVLISVPAFNFLWSGHDVFLGHRRRYTLRHLERVVCEANLRPLRTRYFFASLFPVVCVSRLLDRVRLLSGRGDAKSALKKHSVFVNWALTAVHDLERIGLFRFNRLAGLSVICLASLNR